MKKDLEHYLRLRYPVELVEDEDGGYFAHTPDLPGCIAQGETVEETLKNLQEAKQAWIEVRLEDGLEIPAPREVVEEYSGKFLLRVPRSLHRELATKAHREGTSLNQYVLHLISLGLGREREGERPVHAQAIGGLKAFLDAFSTLEAWKRTGVSQQAIWTRDIWAGLASPTEEPSISNIATPQFWVSGQEQPRSEHELWVMLKEDEVFTANEFKR